MITKAIIKNKKTSSNKFFIRIPIFESAGETNEYVVEATLCYQPGNLDSYVPGDIVYISFENNEISRPVIIGKLYIGNEDNPTNFSNNAKLNVTESAILPIDTQVADLRFKEVYEGLKNNQINQERLDSLEKQVMRIIDILNQGITPGPGDQHITAEDATIDW